MTEKKTGAAGGKAAKPRKSGAAKAAADLNTGRWLGIGGAALGSAALAAAVLYATRARKPEPPKVSPKAAEAED